VPFRFAGRGGAAFLARFAAARLGAGFCLAGFRIGFRDAL
jgi:hypothetical protein